MHLIPYVVIVVSLSSRNDPSQDWQMSGEVLGVKRPENSLLEEHLQFDQTPKTGVVITQSFSEALENLIKQRYADICIYVRTCRILRLIYTLYSGMYM